MEPTQLRSFIRRVLEQEGLAGRAPVELLMLTAAQETHLGKYLFQIKGPAKGIFQIEPNTEALVWEWTARERPEKLSSLMALSTGFFDLEGNLAYQVLLARLNYLSWPYPIPEVSGEIQDQEILDLAKYWKRFWNTKHGAGTVDEAVENYKRFVLEG